MGIFQRFEKRVEGAVSGVFARAFKGDVQPVEIAARLQRELDAEAKLMSRDKKLVPNDFSVGLSQHDHDKLAPYAATLTRELGDELRTHAAERGYVFSGPIRIDLELDSRLPTGRFTVASAAVAGVAVPDPPAGRPASGDAAGAQLHADARADGAGGLGHAVLPGPLARPTHDEQVAVAERVAQAGAAADGPQEQGARGAERHDPDHDVLAAAAADA